MKSTPEELRLSLEQFAILYGLNSTTLANIEFGNDFAIAMLQQTADAYGHYDKESH